MNKTLLGIAGALILIVLVAVLVFGKSFNTKDSAFKQPTGIYCSSDGVLIDKMPIQSHRSYCIKSDALNKEFKENSPSSYTFSIVTDEGKVWKDFAITHTKVMHVIVVRKDLASFQHVHPEFNPETGVFTLSDLTFSTEGEYRIFADFAPKGEMIDANGTPLAVTASEDVGVGDSYDKVELGTEINKKTFGGIEFTLTPTPVPLKAGQETLLTFNLKRGGVPVTDMEKYLGAFGHSVVLREGSLDFTHVHPVRKVTPHGTLVFALSFPEAGRYKIFTQFQREGKVITTDFVVTVSEGQEKSVTPDLEHTIH